MAATCALLLQLLLLLLLLSPLLLSPLLSLLLLLPVRESSPSPSTMPQRKIGHLLSGKKGTCCLQCCFVGATAFGVRCWECRKQTRSQLCIQ
ncbi:hypothetical protein DL89DRAFT_263621 [Linderina pennispora]|uniref:Uncharacterized protein n=1 Tax=Linderina pennispora TaxID=61395 RepID=A0A1Y1WK37_9FUNG|nr:uncharacterized protein DL89DRAFT_263621 [Linderina pennispora]ORX73576.1 hypothetical protein DL89DRAFT_263621 [Linderina pennispora]